MAAGIAFYSMLSLAPLIAFAISVAGLFVAEAVVEEQLLTTAAKVLDQETAEFLAGVIAAAVRMDASGPLMAIIGLFVTVFFASTVFTSLKLALKAIWDVKAEDIPLSGVLSMVSNRLLAAGMVLLTSVALTLTMLASVMSADIVVWLMQRWPQLSEAVSIYQHSNWVGEAVVVGGPVGGLLGCGVKCILDDAFNRLLGVLVFSPTPGLVGETGETYFSETLAPFRYGVLAGAQFGGDVAAFPAIGGQQNKAYL